MNADQPVLEEGADKADQPALSHRLVLRLLQRADHPHVINILKEVRSLMQGQWSLGAYEAHLARFPEGQFCIEDRGRVVAACVTMIVDYAQFGDRHTYRDVTGDGLLNNHDPDGDTMYGVDIFVLPEYQGLRLGRRLSDARKQLCEDLNLRRIIFGGRLPGYAAHADSLSVKEYIEKIKRRELYDSVLSFQLANEHHVRRILRDYLPDDAESGGNAVLMEWINIFYEEKSDKPTIQSRKSVVRVGAVQWQMRTSTIEDVLSQVEYFVDAVAGYKSDFVLFPEFFNGPLMGVSNADSPAVAIRHLAEHTARIRDAMAAMAVAYNINIIAGSMPELVDEKIMNVAYLCRRDGTVASQPKLHITPDEKAYWGLAGGQRLSVFETDVGKVGVLICYDVEFPELGRLLAEQGMKILFVPFWTDTKNAYLRVRRCAQARAIENECYVVITGNVGNLPKVENMDIQYAQAAMFSPADFAFPHDAIIAEATPNTEMTLISDLDLDLLKQLRYQGSVRNFRDRRTDLFRLEWIKEQ